MTIFDEIELAKKGYESALAELESARTKFHEARIKYDLLVRGHFNEMLQVAMGKSGSEK